MKLKGISAVVLAVLAITGCSDSDNDAVIGKDGTRVRVVHLSPDAPAVDVQANQQTILSDVEYRQASGYLEVSEGALPVQVLAAGTNTAVIDANLTLDADTDYTVIAIDNLQDIQPLVISDTTVTAADAAALRVAHLAPAIANVDIYLTGPDTALEGLAPNLADIPFKAVSDELNIVPGDYRVRVTAAGDSNVVYDSGVVTFLGGVEYTALASMSGNDLYPAGLTLLTDTEATPVVVADDARTRVRAVHASANAPEVNILVNDAAVESDLAFTEATAYLSLLNGTYDIAVAAAANDAEVIQADLPLAAMTDYTVIALNQLANIEPLVLQDDNSLPADGKFKLRLVHGAQSAGDVDVYLTAAGADIDLLVPSFEDFAFKGNSGYLEFDAGSYQVVITAPDSKAPVIQLDNLSFAAGEVRTAIARDPLPEASDFSAILLQDRN